MPSTSSLFTLAGAGVVALDQVNAGPLPLAAAGRGEVAIELFVDGAPGNSVTAAFE